jgi:hypothetical protein
VFFEPGDTEDLARRIEYAYSHPQEAHESARRGQVVYRAHNWSDERSRFLAVASELLDVNH